MLMPSVVLEFSLGEIEAGLVFAAAAAEYRLHDTVIAQACVPTRSSVIPLQCSCFAIAKCQPGNNMT
jgi:hypothetical protein